MGGIFAILVYQRLPSGYVNIAIEKITIEIVDFPIENGGSGDFP